MHAQVSLQALATLAAAALLVSSCRRSVPPPPEAVTAEPSASASAAPLPVSASPLPGQQAAEPASPGPDAGATEETLEREEASRSASRSGKLTIKRRDPSGIEFSLLVVNGFYIGDIEGKAERRGATLRYQQPDGGENPCVLTFTPQGADLRIDETGVCYHGVGVGFGGLYRRPGPKVQASFDCRKARSPVEVLICSDEILGAVDREMDRAYRAKKEAAAADDAALVSAQRKWLGELGKCADADSEAGIRCLLRRYLARIGALGGDAKASETTPPALHSTMRAAVERGTFGTIIEAPKVAGVLRVLLGPRYYTFRAYMGSTFAKMDAGYACVRGGPPGLFTILEAIVMVGPTDDVWVAILDIRELPDDSRPKEIDLYAPEARSGDAPPAGFDAWRDRFNHVPVVRQNVRYAP